MELKAIAEGFINSTRNYFKFSSPEIEKKALERYLICLECPKISKNKNNCTKCGCLLNLKTRSSSNCPDSKW